MRLVELAQISKNQQPGSGNGYLLAGGVSGALGAKSVYDAGKLPAWSESNIKRAKANFSRATNEAKNAQAEYNKLRQTPLRSLSARKPGKSVVNRVSPLGRAKNRKTDAITNARLMADRLDRAKAIHTQIPARQAQMRVVGAGLAATGAALGLIGAKKKAGVE